MRVQVNVGTAEAPDWRDAPLVSELRPAEPGKVRPAANRAERRMNARLARGRGQ